MSMSSPEKNVPPLYVRVDEELKEKIEFAAKKTYMSVSSFVRMAVSEYIKTTEREVRND